MHVNWALGATQGLTQAHAERGSLVLDLNAVPPAAAKLELVFDLNLEDIADQERFVDDVITSVRRAANVPDSVNVLCTLSSGSVVATIIIDDPSYEVCRAARSCG